MYRDPITVIFNSQYAITKLVFVIAFCLASTLALESILSFLNSKSDQEESF